MPAVTEEKKQFYASRPLVPTVDRSAISQDEIRKLFFNATSSSTFVAKDMPVGDMSFSDVHKAAQRMPPSTKEHAPFWSREMTRYQQAYIRLPLDGAKINRELVQTFQPADGASSVSHNSVRGLKLRTRYEEEFGSNVARGVNYRPASLKPKCEKHVDEHNKLLFTESVTHETFHQLPPVRPRGAIHPPADKPTNASAGFRFCGHTSYAEDFVDLSKDGYRVELARGRDDSNRVNGNSVPNRLKDYMQEHEVRGFTDVPVEKVLSGEIEAATVSIEKQSWNNNPYLSQYLS